MLFIGDPNLGATGLPVLEQCLPGVTPIIWQRGDGAGRDAARRLIRSRDWALCVSFYSDLILQAADLARIRIALNIHPAAPSLRGRGYDTLPLVLGHAHFGVTLHHMVAEVDAGAIIATRTEALAADTTGTALRAATQQLCLAMLRDLAGELAACGDPDTLERWLDSRQGQCPQAWTGPYISGAQLERMLAALRQRCPQHAVFR